MNRKPENLKGFKDGENVPEIVTGGLTLTKQTVANSKSNPFHLILHLLDCLLFVCVSLLIHLYNRRF